MNYVVTVFGSGTMGQGIAQVAAKHQCNVFLVDKNAEQIQKAKNYFETKKQKLESEERKQWEELVNRINFISGENSFVLLKEKIQQFSKTEGMIIEAIVENLSAKQELFQKAEVIFPSNYIFATNTSSLSIASIASTCKNPQRVIGIHFFNPAHIMPLVEIIPAITTSQETIQSAKTIIDSWNKTTVLAKDTPGFIVNRIARPFYGEALRILEEGIADVPTIDWAMKEIGKFKMGPFELMDLIGNDINFTVTKTVFESFFYDPRYKPSITQQRLMEAKLLGKKTGRGFYDYSSEAKPEPTKNHQLGEEIFFRILVMLINEAVEAVYLNIASIKDIDTAMTKGVNYPKGLLQWADEIGVEKILTKLTELQELYNEERYRPSVLLKKMVKEKKKFYE